MKSPAHHTKAFYKLFAPEYFVADEKGAASISAVHGKPVDRKSCFRLSGAQSAFHKRLSICGCLLLVSSSKLGECLVLRPFWSGFSSAAL
jgi:hypothetical protein